MMRERLMVALDVPDRRRALAVRDNLAAEVGWFKVGLRLFVAEGPVLVRSLLETHRVFLDLKFHDIPNTVAEAVVSAGALGVQMLNVHAAGGEAMMVAAAEASRGFPDMRLIAVTVLTSRSMPEGQARTEVLRLAMEARRSGLHGVVCSAREAAAVKQHCGPDFMVVTPGIRWGGQATQDQKRVATPAAAIRAGADYIVVGRPILQAADPCMAAREAVAMMQGV